MAEIVPMPKLGFDMSEGTLVRWVIQEGETVAKGAVLAEIETDKATVEVESAFEGVVARHLVDEGTVVPVGDPIAVVGAKDEKIDFDALLGAEAGKEEKPKKEKPKEEATPGEAPAAKPAMIAAAPVEEGVNLPAGVRASPLARRMAEDEGIDLKQVHGTGPQGRITKKDIEAFERQAPAPVQPVAAPKPAEEKKLAVPLPAFSPVGPPPPDEHIKLNRLRAAIGRRMTESTQQVPHFYVTHEYNVDKLMALRKQINALLGDGEKVSVNDFVIKAVGLALRQVPNLNAKLNGDEILHFGAINVGIAVSVEGGLLTVVCRDADRKSLRQISVEARTLAGHARDGKVRPDDIEGSTFSVSNLGMFDVENFSAIINPPEAGILAVGSARQIPVVENGEIKIGWRMKATLAVDHRVSDGAEGAKFLQILANYLEEPMRLLL
jgi:pyruvate dehydrogenase E2 component (dihydrolipoyllysine-residue acetyltransferase)